MKHRFIRQPGHFAAWYAAIGLIILATLLFWARTPIRDAIDELRKEPVPSAVPYPSRTVLPTRSAQPLTSAVPSPTPLPTSRPAPQSVNLDIPFVSQAPHKLWDADHEDFCEEAAALMAASYVRGDTTVTDIDVAEAALQRAKTWQMTAFGYFESTAAAETARMLREHFEISAVSVIQNPSEQQIVSWLAAGRAVIVPSAGRMLGNPNFKGLGPLYHMLVVKGYTPDGKFITNDPGTRKGADYLYDRSVIMDAMHDWNNGDVNNGAKVVIVVG